VHRMGKYLLDEVSPVLSMPQLQKLADNLTRAARVHLSDKTYASGKFELHLDEASVRDKFAALFQVSDQAEDDRVDNSFNVKSRVDVGDRWQLFRLADAQGTVRTIGKGDFEYFFQIEVVTNTANTIRIGFLDSETECPHDEVGLGDRSTNGWAFDCTANSSLTLLHDGESRDVHLEGNSAPLVWSAGTTVGVVIDRRKNRAQIIINGVRSKDDVKIDSDFEFLTPAIGLQCLGDEVNLQCARFICDE